MSVGEPSVIGGYLCQHGIVTVASEGKVDGVM